MSKLRIPALALLMIFTVVDGIMYASIVPAWQAPDEPAHFEVAKLMYMKERLVTPLDRPDLKLLPEIVSSLDRNRFFTYIPWANRERVLSGGEFHQPPLYYVLEAATLALTNQQTIEVQLWVMRLVSALMAAGTVALAYLTMRRVFPADMFMQLTVPAFVMLLPMHAFIYGSVNNDNLANLVASLGIFLVSGWLMTGASASRVALLILVVILSFWTKRTALTIVPVALAAGGLEILRNRANLPIRPRLWLGGFGILTIGALIVGLGSDTIRLQLSWLYKYIAYTSSLPSLPGIIDATLKNGRLYAESLFSSFWGAFGWTNVRFPVVDYGVLWGLTGFASIGFGYYYFRAVRDREPQATTLAFYLFSVIVTCVSVIVAFGMIDTQSEFAWVGQAPPQGRYLFPAIIPIATILMLGLHEFIPVRFRRTAAAVLVAGLGAFNLASLFLVIRPYFISF